MKKQILLALSLCCATSVAVAKNDKHDKHGQYDDAPAVRVDDRTGGRHQDEPWLKITITEPEGVILRDYYPAPGKAKPLPPGLQKKVARGGSLPPGWQKKLVRGEVLAPDIYRYATPVPVEVMRRLPPQPRGTVLIFLEGKIVRLVQATREIVDILDL